MYCYISTVVSSLLFLTKCKLSIGEVYSSTARIEFLLENELLTASTLEDFVQNEYKRIKSLKRAVLEYKATVKSGLQYGLDNPVHTYVILKNMSQQWNDIKIYSRSDKSKIFKNISMNREKFNLTLPNEKDLLMSRVGILRLQEIYDLNPNDIALGKIEGAEETGAYFDANDCYKSALLYYADKNYYSALKWFIEARRVLEKEPEKYPEKLKIEILSVYAFTLHKQGNLERALNVTIELKKLDPTNEQIQKDFNFYNSRVDNRDLFSGKLPELKNPHPAPENDITSLGTQRYSLLCRGLAPIKKKVASKLHCYYKNDLPYLRLAPLKVELVYVNPTIRVFRNAMSDLELETIKTAAKQKMYRTMVRSGTGSTVSTVRVAQAAVLTDTDQNEMMDALNRRVHDMTDLETLQSSEKFQIINYGVGGHYFFHYDFFAKDLSLEERCNVGDIQRSMVFLNDNNIFTRNGTFNDRIATVLFYLSSPNAGGATVFAPLNLTLFPAKNDAIFWYNLKSDGEPDYSTFHSGCPVISGKKWIANKWIREWNQEFTRPCGLKKSK